MQDSSYGPLSHDRGQRGQVIPLPGGRYQARYRTGGRDGQRRSKTFDRKRDADAWLRDRLADLDAVRNGDRGVLVRAREASRTIQQSIDDYLDAHEAAPPTIEKLRRQLAPFGSEYGERRLQSLEVYELAAWRKRSNHYSFRAVKQLLTQAVEWDWLQTNRPTRSGTHGRLAVRSTPRRGTTSFWRVRRSTCATRRSPCSPPAPACAPRNGSRYGATTSTSRTGSSGCGACTPPDGWSSSARTGPRPDGSAETYLSARSSSTRSPG